MATRKIAYGTATATGTWSLASLTSGQGRRGPAIDNSSTLALDYLLHVAFLVGTVTSPASAYLYAYASANDASRYETGGSTDAAYNTIRGDEKLITVAVPTANTTTYDLVGAVAAQYDGRCPRNFGGIFSQTNCGTLSSTEGNHTKHYTPITETIA